MARPLRIEYKDAWYHVMNRGLGRQNVFHSPTYYQAFLQGLQEAYQRFGLEVHGYCLMSNHYHLLVKTPRANLSRCVRHVKRNYKLRGQIFNLTYLGGRCILSSWQDLYA